MYGIFYKEQLVIGKNGQFLIFRDELDALRVATTIGRDRDANFEVDQLELL